MILLFLSFIGFVVPQQENEIIELQLEQVYEFKGVVPGSSTSVFYPVHYYKFTIQSIVPNEDVFVVLKTLYDDSANPLLYISRVNEYPTLHDEFCGNEGMDVCIIKEEDIIENTTYYLGVFCKQDCSYELTIHYEEEEVLTLGEEAILTIVDILEQVIRINIPDHIQNLDRLIIQAHYYYDQRNLIYNETFHLYVNIGNNVPTTQTFDYKAEEIWSVGKGVVIYDDQLKPGNLTILLLGQPNSRMYFRSIYFEKIRNVDLFKKTDDLVNLDKVNYYQLQINPEYIEFLDYTSLSFDIHPFDGNPDVYISPCIQECSLNYTNYIWQSQLDQGYESITISPKNRINNGNASKFIIAIVGAEFFSSYSFITYLSNYYSRLLSVYSYESGFLVNKECAQYAIDLYSSSNQIFTITAIFPEKNAFIIVKKCVKNKQEVKNVNNAYNYINNADPDNFYNCSITDEQIQSIQIGSVLQSGTSELRAADNLIQFSYNKDECENDVPMLIYERTYTNCQYVFGIVSLAETMKYTVFIKGQEQYFELQEGISHRSFLMEYDIDLYKFNVQDEDIIDVSFQISVVNGEYNAYASKNNEKPDNNSFDQFANQELDVLQFKLNDSMIGQYYIKVIAKTIIRYSITPILQRKSNNTVTYINLVEGIVHNHLQVELDSQTFFNFEISQDGPLFIHLESTYGYFIAYIISSNGIIGTQQPSENHYQNVLKSSQHTLIIEEPLQYYYLKVQSTSMGKNESFSISYTQTKSLTELIYGKPQITYLDDSHQRFYYFQLSYQLEQIFIVRTYNSQMDENNHLNIYVSTTERYPNNQSNEYNISNSVLTIQNTTINQIFYIGVQSIGYNEFTLLIRGVQGITQLYDDIVQQIPMPTFQEYQSAHLYYIIPHSYNKTIQVQAYTEFTDIQIFCNVVDYFNSLNKLKSHNTSLFPTNNNHQIEESISTTSTSKLLLIPPKYTQHCKEYVQGCAILITAKVDQTSLYTYLFGESYNNVSTVSQLGEDGYFTIMVSSELTTIRNGEMLIGYSGQNILTYYYFYVEKLVQFIQISVRPIDDQCDPDIYVNKLINGVVNYPTIEEHNFSSISYKTDVLIINNTNNTGEYIIGITGFSSDCTYELSLNLADIQMSYIQNGQYIQSQHISQTVYYFYQHSKKESFRILIEGMNYVDVAINTHRQYDNQDGLFDILPYQGTTKFQYFKQHNDSLFGGVIQIHNNDTIFCQYCTYIIAIHPIYECDISIVIAINSLQLPIMLGQLHYDQCDGLCNYLFEPSEINVQSYSEQLQILIQYNNNTINHTLIQNTKYSLYINETYNVIIGQLNQSTQYIISSLQESELIKLQLGKSYNNDNQVRSLFTFTPPSIDKLYTISVSSKSNIVINLYYKVKQIASEFILLQPMQEWRVSNSQVEYKYQLPSVDYQYKIDVETNGTFTIMISFEGIKYIDGNTHYIEQIRTEHQNYNVYCAKHYELYIEKIDCLGISTLNSTQMQKQISGDFFFDIKLTDHVKSKNSSVYVAKNIYSLVAHIAYSHDTWKQTNQNFTIEIKKNNISLSINSMKRNKTGTLSLKLLTYTLHYSNDETLLPAFGCSMDIESLKNYATGQLYHSKVIELANEDQEYVNFNINMEQDYQIMYGIIVFQALYEEHDTPYTYYYPPQLLYNSSNYNNSNDQENNGKNNEEQINDTNSFLQHFQENILYYGIILGTLILIFLALFIRYCIIKLKQRQLKKKFPKSVDEEQEQVKVEQ